MNDEIRQQFSQLQEDMANTQNQVIVMQEKARFANTTMIKAKLTLKEVDSLPEDVRMYATVGRMFLLRDKPHILNELNDAVASSEAKIKENSEAVKKLQSNLA